MQPIANHMDNLYGHPTNFLHALHSHKVQPIGIEQIAPTSSFV